MRKMLLRIILFLTFLVVQIGILDTIKAGNSPSNFPIGRSLREVGRIKINGSYYYILENGEYAKNQLIDEQYYDSDGKACADCVINIDDKLYYFNTLGLQDERQGWKKSEDDWYYIDEDGEFVQDDWVGRYYIGEEGVMLTNQYIDRFYIGDDGQWGGTYAGDDWKVDGNWKYENGNWYYIANGEKQEIDFSKIRSIARCGYDYENPDTPPEQSKDSYEMAKEKGFDVLLCDLRFTLDGVPVCYHYDSINIVARNTDGSEIKDELSVEELTYQQLNEYDWGIYKGEKYAGTKVMTFTEMLSYIQELDVELYVEIKTGNESQIMRAVDMAKSYGLPISWAGTTMEQCEAVVMADASARIATMPKNITEQEIENLLSLKTDKNKVFFFAYNTARLTDKIVEILRSNKIPFEMGTINTIEEMVNYWNGNYNYCTGIESNCIVASQIDLNEYFGR